MVSLCLLSYGCDGLWALHRSACQGSQALVLEWKEHKRLVQVPVVNCLHALTGCGLTAAQGGSISEAGVSGSQGVPEERCSR